MKALIFPFMLLSAVGFVLSVLAHIASLAGISLPGGSFVWGLHMGIFVVWIPTVLAATRITRGTNRKDFWKAVLSGCPAWMRQIFYVVFAYAILNFIWFAISGDDHSHSKGEGSPELIRGFSGHWMVFYGAAFATLYSVFMSPQLLLQRECSNGHPVSYTDNFCPTCGVSIDRPK